MKRFLTLMACISIACADAQDTAKPDFVTIKENITNQNSAYYYQKLMERFAKADTTLTLEERRHLYYGFAFVPGKMDELTIHGIEKELTDVLHKPNPTAADLESVINYTGMLLKAYPFSITLKDYRAYCFMQLGRYKEAMAEKTQSEIIADAILSSGDGKTLATAICVIDAGNEYELARLMGYEVTDEEYLINSKYDYITLHKNSYNLPGLYFDASVTPKAVSRETAGL